jgi:RNA polymerase sigma factor (sigma-70 family)
MNDAPTVFVVDDDDLIRTTLQSCVESVGLAVETYASPMAFLEKCDGSRSGCLILDVRMPGMSGLQLQEALQAKGITLPIIFLTGHGDVPNAVRAMRQGAVDFMEKPFNVQALLDLIQKSVERDIQERQTASVRNSVQANLNDLTAREREVMDLVVAGRSSKEIARKLEISPKTVESHRARIMLKMDADSVVDLVQMTALIPDNQGKP